MVLIGFEQCQSLLDRLFPSPFRTGVDQEAGNFCEQHDASWVAGRKVLREARAQDCVRFIKGPLIKECGSGRKQLLILGIVIVGHVGRLGRTTDFNAFVEVRKRRVRDRRASRVCRSSARCWLRSTNRSDQERETRQGPGNELVGIVPDSPDCLRAGPKRLATRGRLRIALETLVGICGKRYSVCATAESDKSHPVTL